MLNFYIKEKENKMMNNENGRSMVEMLGVLAIIGVLSVAGIAGYSMAMKKYKTNEILNAASQLVVLAEAKRVANGGTGKANTTDDLSGTVAGYAMKATCDGVATGGAPDCLVETTNTPGDDWTDAVSATSNSTYYRISATAAANLS